MTQPFFKKTDLEDSVEKDCMKTEIVRSCGSPIALEFDWEDKLNSEHLEYEHSDEIIREVPRRISSFSYLATKTNT